MTETIHCPECDSRATKDSIEAAIEAVEQHNDQRHGGERVALVNGIKVPDFNEEQKEQIRESLSALKD